MPLLPGLRVTEVTAGQIRTSVAVRPDLPVFGGHYPDFPIVPGVYTVDAVHHSVLAHCDHVGVRTQLSKVTSARFTMPLFPGDELQIDCNVTAVDGGRRASAKCRSARGPVASMRLEYRDAK